MKILAHDTIESARDLYCFLRDHLEDYEGDDGNRDPCIVDILDCVGNPYNAVFLKQHDDGSCHLVLRYIPARRRRPYADPGVTSV